MRTKFNGRYSRYKFAIDGKTVQILSPGYNPLQRIELNRFREEYLRPHGFIYKITNIENDKIYIGKTVKDIFIRFMEHVKGSENSNTHLSNALLRYGRNAFEAEEICICHSNNELNEKERFFIKKYNANENKFGYNHTEGGDGGGAGKYNSFFGKRHVLASIKKMCEKKKGKYIGKDNPNYGNHVLKGRKRPEHSLLMKRNNPFAGKHHKEESKEKARATIRKAMGNGRVGYWKGKKMLPHKELCKCASCMSKRGLSYRRKERLEIEK